MRATLIELEPVAAAYVGFRHWHVDGGRLFSIGRHPLSSVDCPSGAGGFGGIAWPVSGLAPPPCRAGTARRRPSAAHAASTRPATSATQAPLGEAVLITSTT